jgi:hypothetical protein
MPIEQHKTWCSILQGQQDMAKKETARHAG